MPRTNASLRVSIIVACMIIALVVAPKLRSLSAQDVTPTGTATEIATLTATWTETPTPVPTDIPTETSTAPATETQTETPTATSTETATQAATPDAGQTASPTATLIETPTETATSDFLTPSPTTTATETATQPAFPAEPPLTQLFTDNFDTGALYLWTLGNGWGLVASEGGQALEVTNSDEPVTFVHTNLENIAVQARFLFNTGMVRISLRQSEAGSYTALLDANGQVALYRGEQPLGSTIITPNIPDQWRTIRLSTINDLIRVAVDGVEVLVAQDIAPLPPGGLSFAGVGTTTLQVDDVAGWWLAENEMPNEIPVEEVILGSYLDEQAETSSFAPMMSVMSVDDEITEYIQYFDERTPGPGQAIADYDISGSPSAYVDQIDSTFFSWAQAPAAWATMKGPQAGQVSETVNLQLGTDPTKFYRITGISFTLMFPTNPLMIGANERILQFKDGGGNIIYSGECQYVFFSGSSPGCFVGFPTTLDGVRSISITHQSVNEITLDSGEEYHVGLDNIRIAVEESEMVKVNVLEVRTRNGDLLPIGTLPIPYADSVKLEIIITNITGIPADNWELKLMGVTLDGPTPANTSPLKLYNAGPGSGCCSNNSLTWTDNNILEVDSTTTKEFTVWARYSGNLETDYVLTLYSAGQPTPYPGTVEVMDVGITHIEFTDVVKSMIFWAIFNETSEDAYSSGSLEELWLRTDEIGSGVYENKTVYNPEGYEDQPTPAPTDVLSQNLTPDGAFHIFASTDFLNNLQYCDFTSDLPGNNPAPGENTQAEGSGWDSDIFFITHCNMPASEIPTVSDNIVNGDHRYLAAQTIINGFINYERDTGTPSYVYLISNFKGSIGNCYAYEKDIEVVKKELKLTDEQAASFRATFVQVDDLYCEQVRVWMVENNVEYNAPLWLGSTECSTWVDGNGQNPWQEWLNETGYTTYQKALAASNNENSYEPVMSWVYWYLQCQLHHDAPGRRALFQQVFDNFMREINRAINDIGNDPTNGAFSMLDANVDGHSLMTPNQGEIGTDQPPSAITDAYATHIQLLKGNLSSNPRILRPVIFVGRIRIVDPDTQLTIGYRYTGYRWLTKSFQQGNNNYHYPR